MIFVVDVTDGNREDGFVNRGEVARDCASELRDPRTRSVSLLLAVARWEESVFEVLLHIVKFKDVRCAYRRRVWVEPLNELGNPREVPPRCHVVHSVEPHAANFRNLIAHSYLFPSLASTV